MEWWKKMIFPMRRALIAVAARIRSQKDGEGLVKLHDDIQTCGYQDVQVMWEMLRGSETVLRQVPKRKRSYWSLPMVPHRRTPSSNNAQ